jgi:hypothetical protein
MLALLPVTSTQAATATTTLEINFPQILILYTFDQTDLAVDAVWPMPSPRAPPPAPATTVPTREHLTRAAHS